MSASRLESTLSALLTISAMAVAIVLVRRELRSRAASPLAESALVAVAEPKWTLIRSRSVAVSDTGLAVDVVVFTDFECPSCRSFYLALQAVKRTMPGVVSERILHYPLTVHRFARPAARTLVCARRANKAASMYSVLFTKQDSLGLKSWSSFAAEAGVADTAWFGRCLGDTTVEREIDEGRDLGEQLSIIGTPTVFLNGQRYSRPPREEELLDLVRSLVGGTVAR